MKGWIYAITNISIRLLELNRADLYELLHYTNERLDELGKLGTTGETEAESGGNRFACIDD